MPNFALSGLDPLPRGSQSQFLPDDLPVICVYAVSKLSKLSKLFLLSTSELCLFLHFAICSGGLDTAVEVVFLCNLMCLVTVMGVPMTGFTLFLEVAIFLAILDVTNCMPWCFLGFLLQTV